MVKYVFVMLLTFITPFHLDGGGLCMCYVQHRFILGLWIFVDFLAYKRKILMRVVDLFFCPFLMRVKIVVTLQYTTDLEVLNGKYLEQLPESDRGDYKVTGNK